MKTCLLGIIILLHGAVSLTSADATLQSGPETMVLDTFGLPISGSYPSYYQEVQEISTGQGAGALLRIAPYPRVPKKIEYLVSLARSTGVSDNIQNSDLSNTVFSTQIYRGTNRFGDVFNSPWQPLVRQLGEPGLTLTPFTINQNQWILGFSNLPRFVMGTNRMFSPISSPLDSTKPYVRISMLVSSIATNKVDLFTTDVGKHLTKRIGTPLVRFSSATYVSSSNAVTRELMLSYIPGFRVLIAYDPAGPYEQWSAEDGTGLIPLPYVEEGGVFVRTVLDTISEILDGIGTLTGEQ